MMRETALYTGLTPFVLARLRAKNGITGRIIHEQFEQQLSAEDRCFAKLDILLGQLFKNCRTRIFWNPIRSSSTGTRSPS